MARGARRPSMTFGDRPLERVSDVEIEALVTDHVAERQDLDFKVAFDHKAPDAAPKLLRHVASFANGGGGYLVLGIREDGQGRALRFESLQGDVAAQVKSIRSLCLKYLDPRVKGFDIQRRTVAGHEVVLIRVPRSARVPHMMTYRDATEFWTRHGDGKIQMKRDEIREAFQENPPIVRSGKKPRRRPATVVKNGGFERGLRGWGTGLLEALPHVRPFANANGYVPFGGAVARWYSDSSAARTGRRSLRIEHESPYAPHVFSTLSQRIAVMARSLYEAEFWARVEEKGPGALSLRVVASAAEWDRFKVKVYENGPEDWRAYRLRFHTEDAGYIDLRFAAEGPVKAWVDDVLVRKVRPGR